MTRPASFLDKEPAELEEFLLRLARQDAAPPAARQRALRGAASLAAGVGLLSAVNSTSAGSSSLKLSGWLAAKWLTGGLAAGLLSLSAAQAITQLASKPESASDTRESVRKPVLALRAGARVARSAGVSSAPLAENSTPPSPLVVPAPRAAESSLAESPLAKSSLAKSSEGPLPMRAASASPIQVSAPAAVGNSPPPVDETKPSSLSRELRYLERARSALARHAFGEASAALGQYTAEFPKGSLQMEAAALRVDAVRQAGDSAGARALASSFLEAYPSSPLAARVRAAQSFPPEMKKP